MKNVYNILEEIENHFREEPNTNSVKFGVFNETDLKKQTIFPLIQFQIVEITYVGQTVDFTLALMALDEVDESKDYDGSFAGATNLQDVLNTQAMVLNKFVESLREGRGALSDKQIVLKEDPVAEYLYEEFENKLAGWGMEIEISTVNDVTIC
jgi:hypothetical protein|tara:strand:+ start:1364 stop:1822 length:459 start_codon:yes stop_codon:yes gene_type:complete